MKKFLFFWMLIAAVLTVYARENSYSSPRAFIGSFTSTRQMNLSFGNTLHYLGVSGNVVLNSDTSLVRVIMNDVDGNSYLLYEATPMLINGHVDTLTNASEETDWLCGVQPASLKYVVKDATLNVTSLTTTIYDSTIHFRRAPIDQEAIRRSKVQAKVDKINAYNEGNGLLWRAGVMPCALFPYSMQRTYLNSGDTEDFLDGLLYYAGGVIEIGRSPNYTVQSDSSRFVESFDWRSRHNIDWTTPAREQNLFDEIGIQKTDSKYCWAFTGAATIESYINLFYNKKIDLLLSVEDIAAHSGARLPNGGGDTGTWMKKTIEYAKNSGVCLDTIYKLHKYGEPMRIDDRPTNCFAVKVDSGRHCFVDTFVNNNPIDSIKFHLIHNGPMMCGVWAMQYKGNSEVNHAMTLVGYNKIKAGDVYAYYGEDRNAIGGPISEGNSNIGREYWIFKDSYLISNADHEYDGFVYVIFKENSAMFTPAFFEGEVSYVNANDSLQDMLIQQILDRDGDGYYTWGLNRPKPASLPDWVPNKQDGDDSNCLLGPLTFYGKCEDLTYDDSTSIYIDSDTIFKSFCYLSHPIFVRNGAVLTISCKLKCNGQGFIFVQDGASVNLHGGELENISIVGENSGKLNISQNSQLNISRYQNNIVKLQSN